MRFSIISEDFKRSMASFVCVDSREPLYSSSTYEPTSSLESIIWESEDGNIKGIGNIADNGDLCVSREFAELVMSFDPYGIECYPATIKLANGTLDSRYLLALNNVVDVIDEVKSKMRKSPKRDKMLIKGLYISEDKLTELPICKRVVFRIKGAETYTIFCHEIYDLVVNDSQFSDLRTIDLDCSKEVPKF
ncbi:hypothetical protein ACP3V5_13525 [Vibrio maritimus]